MAGRSVGRPRTTIDDLPENWQDIMQECGQEGGSATEARAMLGIGDSAWYTLLEDSEQFRRAEKKRSTLSAVWWERLGRKGAAGEHDINPTVWIFNMKNRFGWRDRTEVDNKSSDGTMSPKDQSAAVLSALVRKHSSDESE